MLLFVDDNTGILFIKSIIQRLLDSFGTAVITASHLIPMFKLIYAKLIGDTVITNSKTISSSEIVQTDDIIKSEVVKSIDSKPTISSNTIIPKIKSIVDIDVVPEDVIYIDITDDSDIIIVQPPLDVEIIEGRSENDSSITETIKPDAPTIEGK